VKTVVVNNRTYNVSGNVKIFVAKLELGRNAVITWQEDGSCIVTDNAVQISKPLTSLSSGYKTTIKDA